MTDVTEHIQDAEGEMVDVLGKSRCGKIFLTI